MPLRPAPAPAEPAPAPAEPAPAPAEPAPAPEPTAAEALALSILPPPADAQGIARRIERVEKELRALEERYPATTQPATEPETAPADPVALTPARRLHQVLSLYLAELRKWQTIDRRIQELISPQVIETLSRQIGGWDQQRQHYQARLERVIRFVQDAEVQELATELERQEADLREITSRQNAREQQLANMPALRSQANEAIRTSLEQLREYVGGLPDRLAAARTDAEREALMLEKRVLEWEHNLELLRAAQFTDLRTLQELERQHDSDRLGSLGPYVTVLREYQSKLQQTRLRSDADWAAERLARPDLPEHRRAYWEMVLEAAEGTHTLQELDEPTRARFPVSEHERLERRITQEQKYWDDFLDRIDRRPGEAILNAYLEIGERLREDRVLLQHLQQQWDRTSDEHRRVIELRERTQARIAQGRQRFDALMKDLTGEDLVQAHEWRATLTTETLPRFFRLARELAGEQEALEQRLREAITLLTGHQDFLALQRSSLYWSYLMVPSRGLFRQDWDAVQEELEAIRLRTGPPAEGLQAYVERASADLARVRTERWAALGLILVLTLWLAWRSRARLNAWAETERQRLEAEYSPPQEGPAEAAAEASRTAEAPLGLRLLIQFPQLVARTALLAWPLAMLPIALFILQMALVLHPVVVTVVVAFLLGYLGAAALRILFDPAHPHLRLVPCRDSAARYHFRWLRLLLILGVLLVPIPIILAHIGIVPGLRSVLWEWLEAALLLLALVYLLRRAMFFTECIPAATVGQIWRVLYRKFFLLLPLAMLALIVLKLANYGVLTDYLVRGVLWTVLILGAAKLVRAFLAEWVPQPPPARSVVGREQEAQTTTPIAEALGRPVNPVLGTVAQLLRFLILVVGLVFILRAWEVSLVEIRHLLSYELVVMGTLTLTPLRFIAAGVAVVVGIFVSRALRSFINSQLFAQTRAMDRGAQAAVSTLLHYTIVAVSLYIALVILNLDLGALVVLLGTFGLGLGLGLQPLFVNFVSGIFVLLERHIKVGDLVEVNSQVGEVTSISMRSTTIRSFDNVETVVPNGEFITGQVVNWTLSDSKVRGRVDVGVAYGSDVQLVRKLLLDVAHRHENVLVDPKPDVWFLEFGDNSLQFVLVCWFANMSSRWGFISQIRFEIDALFRQHGIEIPFPQRTISLAGNKPLRVQMVDQVNGQDEVSDHIIRPDEEADLTSVRAGPP